MLAGREDGEDEKQTSEARANEAARRAYPVGAVRRRLDAVDKDRG
jgi:hypothetical protein